MKIEKLTEDHLTRIRLCVAHLWFKDHMGPDWRREVLAAGPGYAAIFGEDVVAIAGVCDMGHGRAQAWCLMGDGAGRHMTLITRAVRRFFRLSGFRRIEAIVKTQFAPGHRWMRLLGFTCEAPNLAKYFADDDGVLYARIC